MWATGLPLRSGLRPFAAEVCMARGPLTSNPNMRTRMVMGAVTVLAATLAAGFALRRDHQEPFVGPARFVAIATGGNHTCLLHGSGRVACVGARALLYARDKDIAAEWVPGAERAIEVHASDEHGCLRQREGKVWCWGFRPDPANYEEIELSLYEPAPPVLTRARLMLEDVRMLSQGAASAVSTRNDVIAFGVLPTFFSIFLPRSLRQATESVGAVHMRTLDADVVQYAEGQSHRCWRHADGRAQCDSTGVTDGMGRPFSSLEAPKQRVLDIGVSQSQMCFVLEDGAVECRSTDGVLEPSFAFKAEAAVATARMVCALHLGTLTCRDYRSERPSFTLEPPVDLEHGVRAIAARTFQVCALHGDSEDRVSCWDSSARPPVAITLPAL